MKANKMEGRKERLKKANEVEATQVIALKEGRKEKGGKIETYGKEDKEKTKERKKKDLESLK